MRRPARGGVPEPMEQPDPARLASEHEALREQAETLLASIGKTRETLGREGHEIAGLALAMLFSDERELLDVLRMDPHSCEEILRHERWRAPLQRLRSHAVHQLDEAEPRSGDAGGERRTRTAISACNRLLEQA